MHIGRYERKARYSLVLSIEAPDVEVHLYAAIAILAAVVRGRVVARGRR
jgi:hypothetical protein